MSVLVKNIRASLGIGTVTLGAFSLLGVTLIILRWVTGLGATTALTDARGWGLWISFDVICGIALAGGAFTLAAIVYIFHINEFYPILRPTILTGFIGYILAALSVAIDLGFPQRIWHMIIHWNLHSPLFEVGCCVMVYGMGVLSLESSPILLERLNLKSLLKIIRVINIPLVIVGIGLSTMHQSSLGTLFVMMPHRVNPLWYSSLLPVLFLITAVATGLAMIIVESTLSSIGLNRGLEIKLMGKIGKIIPYVLSVYLLIKGIDIIAANKLGLLFAGDLPSILFWLELIIGVILPIILFSMPSVRKKRFSLFSAASFVLIGLILNRFNISLITFNAGSYAPTWQEWMITLGMISIGVLVFTLASRYLKVFPEHTDGILTEEVQAEQRTIQETHKDKRLLPQTSPTSYSIRQGK